MVTNLLLALSFFILSHAVPAFPGVKQALVQQVGRKIYLAIYILMSLGAFTWVILAALSAPSWQIWEPLELHFTLALMCMLLSCLALALGLLTPNPFSLSVLPFRAGEIPAASLSWTRHPLLWALVLWSAGHILANGDTTGVLLFGTLGAFSAIYMPILDARKKATLEAETWERMSQKAPLLPFGGQTKPSVDSRTVIAFGLGVALFIILMLLHEPVIGISPIWIFTR